MYLQQLELSGFKSFARKTVFEFPSRITAIVGPNGSGKSNVKEAMQWVLGEQSMKSLRGKKGEDLIWNGSATVPRMGKASVLLSFDNSDKKIPIEFEMVTIGRKIFRDGLNEYFLNQSSVRLKDVVELCAKIGLGESRHNIIGQGEVDRILLAGPKERKSMLEEALGLHFHQLKKAEAERKLASTEQNMSHIAALLHEIAPHLKFLRQQVEKAHQREKVIQELARYQYEYVQKEHAELQKERDALQNTFAPLEKKKIRLQHSIQKIVSLIHAYEQQTDFGQSDIKDKKVLADLESRQKSLERELGKLEARFEIEQERASRPIIKPVDHPYLKEKIGGIMNDLWSAKGETVSIDEYRRILYTIESKLIELVRTIEKGTITTEITHPPAILQELQNAITATQLEIKHVAEAISEIFKKEEARVHASQLARLKMKTYEQQLRALQEEERDVAIELERFHFEKERMRLRERQFSALCEEWNVRLEDIKEGDIPLSTYSGQELQKKIERLRMRLEEIGSIDPSVTNEFQETETRHAFLTHELNDLTEAAVSLKQLIKELGRQVQRDFKSGFSIINKSFHQYFQTIFGGGRASLELVKPTTTQPSDRDPSDARENPELCDQEEGVDIAVDIPRKRIKGLAMLSGGERALTSIALLFAITTAHPPPFLILDETDAALDEANSQRFANILKELAKKTQLLIVTHNRETMKCADVLYGITMGEDGVSKLLSLKFEEAEQYTNR